MNREIKFRVWSKEFEKFLTKEEWFFDFDGDLYFWNIVENDMIRVPENKYIIQQFTGLLDKHGKDIYEGDLISFEKQEGVWSDQLNTITEVKYPFICGNAYLGEVIGNIHENPELLKQ